MYIYIYIYIFPYIYMYVCVCVCVVRKEKGVEGWKKGGENWKKSDYKIGLVFLLTVKESSRDRLFVVFQHCLIK